MNPGIIGAIMGVAGGLVGTYFSIRNTNGPRERAFMVRLAIVGWMGVLLFLATMLLVPPAWPWLWIAYGILLPVAIVYGNRKQMSIRREEQSNAEPGARSQ